jgi:hypothetical protein
MLDLQGPERAAHFHGTHGNQLDNDQQSQGATISEHV